MDYHVKGHSYVVQKHSCSTKLEGVEMLEHAHKDEFSTFLEFFPRTSSRG